MRFGKFAKRDARNDMERLCLVLEIDVTAIGYCDTGVRTLQVSKEIIQLMLGVDDQVSRDNLSSEDVPPRPISHVQLVWSIGQFI